MIAVSLLFILLVCVSLLSAAAVCATSCVRLSVLRRCEACLSSEFRVERLSIAEAHHETDVVNSRPLQSGVFQVAHGILHPLFVDHGGETLAKDLLHYPRQGVVSHSYHLSQSCCCEISVTICLFFDLLVYECLVCVYLFHLVGC